MSGASEMDLEGIVAKHRFGVYVTEQERTSWFKIKNRSYSQWQVVKNYSSENVTRNLLLAGIAVDWLVRGRNMHCEIEYVTSGSDNGTLCGKPAVAKCADCGSAICSDCRMECCSDTFCEACYDCHVTHFCVRKPFQTERHPMYDKTRTDLINTRLQK